jgi:RNA polymerase sigma-32 factor
VNTNSYQHDAPLSRYIDHVKKLPLLSREAEHELAVKAKAGDKVAIDKLVEANLRYVTAIALQYRRYGIPLGELIAEGNLGLMTAVRKFDPDRGTRFVTYAGYWIRAFVLDLVVKSTTMVGAGTGPLRSKLFFRLRRERARVANLAGDEETRNEMLAKRFGVTPEKIAEMLRRLDSRDVSLDNELFDDGKVAMVDLLADDSDDQEVELMVAERKAALEGDVLEALDDLDKRERFIVERRMMGDVEESLASIGRELGVSRERARQLEARAKKKLRGKLEKFAPAKAA